jgi:penicillin-binding protein 1C
MIQNRRQRRMAGARNAGARNAGARSAAARRAILSVALVFALAAGAVNLSSLITGLGRSSLTSPEATVLFEDRNGVFLSDRPNADDTYGYWEIGGELPSRIVKCVVASEDRRFYRHPGIDPTAIVRALLHNTGHKSVQGASTIAMQVARLQTPAPRTVRNKIVEMYAAFFMVARHGRDDVLRHYLRIAPQGNQMQGFAYSARRYFRKPLDDLSWAEAALLTSLIRSPGRLNLFDYSGFLRARRRADLILSLLYKDGTLDSEEYRVSLAHLSSISYQRKENRPENSYHYIFRLLDSYQQPEVSSPSRPVRVSLDTEIQDYLQAMADRAMESFRPFGAGNTALMVVDRKNGDVLGYIGSQSYFDEAYKGSINYAATPRSTGSTLKPFLFALGLQSNNFTPASVLADLPFHVLSPSGEYTAGNFDGEYLGPMLYRRALANSRNIPPLRVLESIGLQATYQFFQSLGLSDASKPVEHYGYGLVIGGLYSSLEQILTAYGVLANDGKAFDLRWVVPTQTSTDRPLARHLISESAARQVSLFLSDPLSRLPTFPRLRVLDFPFPVAIKTGTSEGFRDAWTIGYSSEYIAGIWVGHPDNERMNHVPGSVAAELLQSIFLYLQPEARQGINEKPFPPPRDSLAVGICVLSGRLATTRCSNIIQEYFVEGTQPHSHCDVHREFVANPSAGGDRRIVKAVFPPEYAAWAAAAGYDAQPAVRTEIPETGISIVSPLSGSRLIIDPETPRNMQTLPLRAEVTPSIPSIVWYIDGEPSEARDYPYETRWRLEEGEHTFQAKFARANVFSDKVYVTVSAYQ